MRFIILLSVFFLAKVIEGNAASASTDDVVVNKYINGEI
jgi:hypothetical protein